MSQYLTGMLFLLKLKMISDKQSERRWPCISIDLYMQWRDTKSGVGMVLLGREVTPLIVLKYNVLVLPLTLIDNYLHLVM